ncbi:MAG TPA: R3H domain-containing nucleic acid-binding protein [Actinomycetota bacterium]|jgi:spoIIIJ-associated protein|nr:R3H domain-containing nucleic acid-binding protein [Actinomycetota bacterium]
MAERRDDDIDIEEQADAVADFVEELLTRMEIDAIAEPTDEGGRMYVDILDGDDSDMALLIGKQGATLDAIQELVRQVVGRRLDERIRVLVDVEDYRKRRTSKVEEKARSAAETAVESGEEQALEPMDALERKIAHDAVADMDGVRTESKGEEPDRYVVVFPE